MEYTKYLFRIIGVIITIFINHVVAGQQNNSLYFLDRVPQSIQLNPALQPSNTFYIGFPALSGFEINAGNNALGFNDIFIQNNELDMVVTPLYSKDLTLQALDKLRKHNIFSADAQVDLISFGFKIRDNYLSFLIADRFSMRTDIPKDLALFAYQGIDVGKTYSFDFGAKATYFREYSIGYSQKISDRLYFGIRGKMLFGKANFSAGQTSISLNEPDWQTIEVSASMKVNTSVPLLNVYTDAKGRPDSIGFRETDSPGDFVREIVMLRKNLGFGLDLGLQYNLNDKIALSASLTDLGYINWKSNVNSLTGGGDYSFHGIDINNDSTDIAEVLLDTLKNVYDISLSSNPYMTGLTPKLYVGFCYTPNRFIRLGVLSRSEYMFKTIRQQFTGSVTLYPIQFFGATFSYTVANRMYDNLGTGLVFRGGPWQVYFMSDRIPLFWNKVKGGGAPYVPAYGKDVNFRMGMNLVFGANAKRKLKKDQPFLE